MLKCRAVVGGMVVAGSLGVSPAAAEFRWGTEGENSLHISGRVQFRYTGWDQSGAEENSFRIRRLRIKLDGDAFPHVQYEIELDADPANGSRPDRIRLLDANVVFNYHPRFQVKAGQFKAPFGGEQLGTSDRLYSIDRALLDDLTPSRQLGVMLTSAPDDDLLARGSTAHKVDYGVGIFNGNGINSQGNDDSDGLVAGRVVVAPTPHLSVGVNAFSSKDPASTAASLVGLAAAGRRTALGFDVLAESGPFSIRAELVDLRFNPERAEESDRTLRGFFVQPSFYAVKDRVQIWYRFDSFDPNAGVEDNLDKRWSHVGVNYFLKEHLYKVQAEYIAKRERGRKLEDDTFLIQFQVAF